MTVPPLALVKVRPWTRLASLAWARARWSSSASSRSQSSARRRDTTTATGLGWASIRRSSSSPSSQGSGSIRGRAGSSASPTEREGGTGWAASPVAEGAASQANPPQPGWSGSNSRASPSPSSSPTSRPSARIRSRAASTSPAATSTRSPTCTRSWPGWVASTSCRPTVAGWWTSQAARCRPSAVWAAWRPSPGRRRNQTRRSEAVASQVVVGVSRPASRVSSLRSWTWERAESGSGSRSACSRPRGARRVAGRPERKGSWLGCWVMVPPGSGEMRAATGGRRAGIGADSRGRGGGAGASARGPGRQVHAGGSGWAGGHGGLDRPVTWRRSAQGLADSRSDFLHGAEPGGLSPRTASAVSAPRALRRRPAGRRRWPGRSPRRGTPAGRRRAARTRARGSRPRSGGGPST